MITPIAHTFYPANPASINISGSTSFVAILVHSTVSGGGVTTMPSATLDGNPVTVVGSTAYDRCNIDLCYVSTPGAGSLAFVPTWNTVSPSWGYALEVYEFSGVSGIDNFTSLTYGGISGTTSTKTVSINNLSGRYAIISGSTKDDNEVNVTAGVPDVDFTQGYTLIDGRRQIVSGYVTSLADDAESFDLVFNDSGAGGGTIDGFVTVSFTLIEAPNQPPTADDDTFTILTTAQNGDTVGTYTATDLDGSITGYSITGTVLSITSAGVITLLDNSGLVAGTPIVETVTVTDNEDATDTATITVNVVEPPLTINSLSATSAKQGVSVTINLANANPSGKLLASPAGFIPLTFEDATTMVFTVPDVKTFGTRTLPYGELVTLTVIDDQQTAETSFTFLIEDDYDYSTITEINGIYLNDTGLQVGSQGYGHFLQGTGTADLTVGAISPDTLAQYEYWLRDVTDGVWSSTSAVEMFEDPYKTKVTLASPVFTEGSVLEGYTGITPVTGDFILHDPVTSPDSIGVTIDPTGVWSLDSMPATNQTFDMYAATSAGVVGPFATITYQAAAFSIGTMPTNSPQVGSTLTVPVFGVGPYTATYAGQALTIASQTASQVEFTWPDLSVFGNSDLTLDAAYDLVITDTSDDEFDTESVTTTVATGQQYGQVTSIDPAGAYADVAGLLVGDYVYIISKTGDIVVDITDGSYVNDVNSTIDLKVYSGGNWGNLVQLSYDGEPLPVITQQPTAGAVTYGDNTSSKTFTVAATDGTGNLTYQWEYSDNSGGSYTNVTGGTQASLTVTGDQFVDGSLSGRLYRCKVSNVGGTTTSNTASLVLVAPSLPTIIVQPSAGTVQAGNVSSTHTFSVTASSATGYQWEFSDGGSYTNVIGATSSSLVVSGGDFINNSLSGRLYRCKVSNGVGTVTSNAVSLTITPAVSTAPTLSLALAEATGATTAIASVVTNEVGGTLYTLFSTSAVATENNIRTNGTSQTVTILGVQNATGSGLTTDTEYYAHFVHVDSDGNSSNVLASDPFTTGLPDPVIYSIDGDNDVYPGQSCLISGQNFGNAVGTVTLGGQQQIVTSWSPTLITVTIVRGSLDYASGLQLVVTLP